MFSETLLADQGAYEPLPIAGASERILRAHPETGAITSLLRLEPGAEIPCHAHSHADEEVLVIEGDFHAEGQTHLPGAYFFAPKGVPHGPARTERGCLLLTRYDGPVDFVPAQDD